MIIQGRERAYEAIRKLDMEGGLLHYVCKASGESGSGAAGEESQMRYHLIKNDQPLTFPAFLSFLAPIHDNPAFTDLKEIILKDDAIFLVFPYPEGQSLLDFMGLMPSLKKRFETGKTLLEALVLQMFPAGLMTDVVKPERIFVNDKTGVVTGFLYCLLEASEPNESSMKTGLAGLAGLLRRLFEPELSGGLYPEFLEFVALTEGGAFQDVMEGYQEYVKLIPVSMDERKSEEKPKKQRFSWLKRLAKRKRLLGFLLILLLLFWGTAMAGPYIWKQAVFPRIEAAYLVKTMAAGSPEAAAYTGRVVLTDSGMKNVVFSGRLKEGRKEGRGLVFGVGKVEGRPLYDGEFKADRYDGEGVLYYENGSNKYKGDFVNGRMEGQGSAYDESGRLLYQGGFADGLYDGTGFLYENSRLIYEGGFHRGLYDGDGTRYDGDGGVMEKGVYSNGILHEGSVTKRDKAGCVTYRGGWNLDGRNAQGIAYENGQKVYEGIFKNDRYDGTGKLFSPKTGDLIYEGGFFEGQFSGKGRSYEPGSRFLIYEGDFRLGVYDGKGKEYDANGNLCYEGEFKLGSFNGKGIRYNPDTGVILEEGEFRNGILATPAAEAGMEGEAGTDTAKGSEPAKVNGVENEPGVNGEDVGEETNGGGGESVGGDGGGGNAGGGNADGHEMKDAGERKGEGEVKGEREVKGEGETKDGGEMKSKGETKARGDAKAGGEMKQAVGTGTGNEPVVEKGPGMMDRSKVSEAWLQKGER